MQERNQHARAQPMNLAELDAREDAAERNYNRLLAVIYQGPGVAYGLEVTVDGSAVRVSPGVALYGAAPALVPVFVGAERVTALPSSDGDYGLYLRGDARVDREPITITPPQQGQPGYDRNDALPRTLYRRTMREAFFSATDLPARSGTVRQPGLVLAYRAERVDGWLELAVLSVRGGALVAFNDAPETRLIAHTRGDHGAEVAYGAVGLHQLASEVAELLARIGEEVTPGQAPALLAVDGSRALTGDLDLGGHALTNIGHDVSLGGNALLSVGAITPAGGVEVFEINVERVGGLTARELVAEARAGVTHGSAWTRFYAVNKVINLGPGQEPGVLRGSWPADLPEGKRLARFFGEGQVVPTSGDTLTFAPNLRESALPPVPLWRVGAEDAGERYAVGDVIGLPTGFYASVLRLYEEDGAHRYVQSLQRVLPLQGAATLVDSVQGTLAVGEEPPKTLSLRFVGSSVYWQERAQALTGEASLTWVDGCRLSSRPRDGTLLFVSGALAFVSSHQPLSQSFMDGLVFW